MKKDRLTTQLFHNTTVDVKRLDDYLKALPIYAEVGYQDGASQETLDILLQADWFDIAFRSYLSGRKQTLRRVYQSIQRFEPLDKATSWHMIACCLEVIQSNLLVLEAYELVPRYQQARKRIEERYCIDLDGCLKVAKRRVHIHKRRKRLFR